MQHRIRFGIVIVLLTVVAMGVLGAAGTASGPVMAQGGDECEQLVANALAAARESCGDLARGEVCLGHAAVAVSASAGAGEIALAAPGDRASIAALDGFSTVGLSADASEWGVAAAMLSGGLPAEDAGVAAFLYGDARLERPAQVVDDRPTLVVRNAGSAEVNLRSGAGSVGFDVIGTFAPGDEALADGRNQQADWIRIRYKDMVAWVFTPLISWEGDLQALEVLLPDDLTTAAVSGEPFDMALLTTGPANTACAAASSGLLLQHSGENTAQLTLNGVGLEFSDAALVLSAAPNEALEVKVLTGSVSVTARGVSQVVDAGEKAQVRLGGDDGLTPVATPAALGPYALLEIADVPLSLMSGTMVCKVGLPQATADVRLRVGPGDQRGELAQMSSALSYTVSGWANDPEGQPWWQLDTGAQKAWVRQSQVRAVGDCDAVAQVEAPPVVLGGQTSPASGGEAAAGPDLAPTANSVWQMRVGTDQMSGQCSGAPAINFCDHLAAIAPTAGGISWKGMEAAPYFLTRVQPNVYSYSGPNVMGTGQVNMTLTFSAENQINMTMVLTLNSEPNCQHTYFYTGTKNW